MLLAGLQGLAVSSRRSSCSCQRGLCSFRLCVGKGNPAGLVPVLELSEWSPLSMCGRFHWCDASDILGIVDRLFSGEDCCSGSRGLLCGGAIMLLSWSLRDGGID